MVKNKVSIVGYMLRCPGCHRKRQLQTGIFLEGSRLQVNKFVGLLFLWAHEAPIKMVLSMTGVSSVTAVQWYQYFRDICSWKLVNSPMTLGGPGKIVQIDESVMVKAKYHRGYQLHAKQRWVFGIYDPSTKEGHIELVEQRDAPHRLWLHAQLIARSSISVS